MATDSFQSGDLRLAYDDVGEGDPVVLVHGFASSRGDNWREPGWYDALVDAGWRVVALDVRGHGESDKPHDPAAYEISTMADDILALIDQCSVEQAALMGYSMGSRIAARLLLDHPDRFTAVVLGGIGSTMLEGWDTGGTVAEALEADDPDDVTDQSARRFRTFAERRGNDLQALAANQRAPRSPVDRSELAMVDTPVLVVLGADDDLVGDLDPLVEAIPGAESVLVSGGDHLSTVGDRRYMECVVDFLDRVGQ